MEKPVIEYVYIILNQMDSVAWQMRFMQNSFAYISSSVPSEITYFL